MELTGRKIIITGGGRGMGKRFALDLKKLGALPFALDVMQESLDALKEEHGIPGRVVDVSDEKQVVDFFEGYVAGDGCPDVLVNNAGITADALFIKKKGDEIIKFPL